MQNFQLIDDLCLINNIKYKSFNVEDNFIKNNFQNIIDKLKNKIIILTTLDYSYILIKKEKITFFGPFEKNNLIIYDNAKLIYFLIFKKTYTKKKIESFNYNYNLNIIKPKASIKNKKNFKDLNIFNILEDSVKNGDIESTKIYIKVLFQSLNSFSKNIELIRLQKNLVIYIFTYIFSTIDNNNIDPDFNIFLTSIITSEFEFCDNSSQLLFKTYQLLDKISDSFDFTSIKNYQNIKEAKYFINNHLEKKLTLEKVANEMGISAKYLSTLFFEVTNTTFKEYVNRQRIDKAKNLLTYSTKSLNEISNEIGIKSPNNFISFFKKYTFFTPNQYREEIKMN